MVKLFGNLKKFFKSDVTIIDNFVFRLHYKATVWILIVFGILVIVRQYIRNPIDCISSDSISKDLLDTFCWIHSTFSVANAWHKKVGMEVPYPGVDKYTPGEKRVYHSYYHWVCFVLLLQAGLFYFPRYFWKTFEGGRMKNLILGLSNPIISKEAKEENRNLLIDYLLMKPNKSNIFFYLYVTAEVMNFVNVVGQMFLTDVFLGGEFWSYGLKVMQFTEWDPTVRYDPMVKVFPRLTKCTFQMYSSSGIVQRHDALCLLPVNVINEKIYVFLWFWFIVLACMSGAVLIYRALIISLPRIRFMILRHRSNIVNNEYLEPVCYRCKLGDWLVLDLLCKNMDSVNFRDLIKDYAQRLGHSGIGNV